MKHFDSSDVHAVIGPEDLERVGKFRYLIYVEEQGKPAIHANHEERTLIEPADRRANSSIYWIESQGQIIGTVRAEILSNFHPEQKFLGLEAFDFVEPSQVIYFSRLMIARNGRGSRIAPTLCFTGFQLGIVKNCMLGVLLCKPNLVPLFESYGYVPYADEFIHPEFGGEVPMAIIGEVDYLNTFAPSLGTWLARYRTNSFHTASFLDRIARFRGMSASKPMRDRYLVEER